RKRGGFVLAAPEVRFIEGRVRRDSHGGGSRVSKRPGCLCNMARTGSAPCDAMCGACVRGTEPSGRMRAGMDGRARIDMGAGRVGMGRAPGALQQVLQRLQGARVPLVEPFWPARPRFDDIVPKAGAADWFAVAAAEQYER